MIDLSGHSGTRAAPVCEKDYAPFDPLAYMYEYYASVGSENQALLRFFDRAYDHIFAQRRQARILEYGGGPTIYQLLSAARYDVTVDVSDYLDVNLRELRTWLRDEPGQFSWDAFVAFVLGLEGHAADCAAVRARADLLRSKVRRLLHCDARSDWPLETTTRECFDIVSANFVLEAITGDVDEWRRILSNVLQLVSAEGYFVLSTVIDAEHYRVGDRFYPSTPLTPATVLAELRRARYAVRLTHQVDSEQGGHQGYGGIFMVLAQRSTP